MNILWSWKEISTATADKVENLTEIAKAIQVSLFKFAQIFTAFESNETSTCDRRYSKLIPSYSQAQGQEKKSFIIALYERS